MIRRVTISLLLLILLLEGALMYRLWRGLAEDPTHRDFGRFHAAVRAADQGGSLYDATAATARRPGDGEYLDVNAPHFHLLVLPLQRLAPLPALVIWQALALLAVAATLTIVVRAIGWSRWPLERWLLLPAGLFLFPGMLASFWLGQVGALLALVVTGAWAGLRTGRMVLGGACLGAAIALKPFLAPLLVYPCLRREWRAVSVAMLTMLTLVGAGMLAFGVDAYEAWLEVIPRIDWEVVPFNASVHGFLARAFHRSHGMSFEPPFEAPVAARLMWLASSTIIVGLTLQAARRAIRRPDAAFAMLAVAGILLSPLGWIYYHPILIGPLVALATEGEWRWPGARRSLTAAAALLLMWPPAALWIGHPHPLATLTLASAYFWGTLALWLGLRRVAEAS